MPRKGKRSQAAKQRWQPLDLADQPISPSTQQTAQPETPPPAPSPWTKTDAITPSQSPAQKFVLLVGDSHLRAIADGFVAMPDGALSFGVLSIPGASAAELRTEVLNVVLPRTPEAVCLLGPSNNLCSSRTVSEAGADFGKLLKSVCGTWPSRNVFVLDFPPRLNIDVALQDLLRQEYHRVAARMATGEGDSGCNGAEDFSQDITTCQKGLPKVVVMDETAQPETPPPAPSPWAKKDAITPSQSPAQKMARLPIAALAAPVVGRTKKTRRPAEPKQQGQTATLTAQPETPPPAPSSSPPARRVSPKVVVMDEVAVPRPSSPFEWTVVGRTKKTHRPAEPEQQVDHSFPLNPVWFSPAILDAMEEAVPSHLPSAVECRALGKGGKVIWMQILSFR
ncbi:hypothetical protein AAFF_G00038190 [Aldrovandia affinis]|uniref:Uncharacterized protein n=1 Tax=Aldrovandia affinis TaxID=143900 RepID=A0AAD7T546_9TELE|nr:hypothetical protein AAFF_G00038190 [Aldrovandia affinis]